MLKDELKNFYGSEKFYQYSYGTVLTEGIKYFADRAEAFWLLDDIVLNARCVKELKHEEFIVAKTYSAKDFGKTGVIVKYEDGNNNVLIENWYPDSKLPDDEEFIIWFVDNTLLLPSEY